MKNLDKKTLLFLALLSTLTTFAAFWTVYVIADVPANSIHQLQNLWGQVRWFVKEVLAYIGLLPVAISITYVLASYWAFQVEWDTYKR